MRTIKDKTFRKILKNPDVCVSWYLMASYLYYKTDKIIMTDDQYDAIGKRIIKEWKKIKHPHKKLLTINNRHDKVVSGFYIKEYPMLTKNAALQVFEKMNKKEAEKSSTHKCIKGRTTNAKRTK